MCLACEAQQEFFRVWCADMERKDLDARDKRGHDDAERPGSPIVARGERPPGVSPQDLLAMGLPVPPSAAVPPGPSSARRGQGAATFTCDSPDE
jgi:hypothetical protein